MAIPDAKLRAAVDDYAERIVAISIRERQIADIDKEVLGTEGRLISASRSFCAKSARSAAAFSPAILRAR